VLHSTTPTLSRQIRATVKRWTISVERRPCRWGDARRDVLRWLTSSHIGGRATDIAHRRRAWTFICLLVPCCASSRRSARRGLDHRAPHAHLIDSAARCLEQLATLQPGDESVHGLLMELDIMRGRRSDAVRRYASLRPRIRRTFGHDPDFTPADLASPKPQGAERILRGA
jgi:hypothetical protein